MERYFNADDFFRTFNELDEEPYNRFPGADVILLPAKEVREIVDRYCERFCYYRKTYFGRFKDVDVATEHLERKCENCPLSFYWQPPYSNGVLPLLKISKDI